MKKKTIALLMACVLLFGVAAGGTLAWLLDKTAEVKNTFTTSNVDIELAETKEDFKMVPGHTIEKDPTVTVKANSEKCYVFVKVEKSTNLDTYITYSINSGWTAVENETGVYYQVVDAKNTDQAFAVIKDNKVTVNDTVTNQLMAEAETTEPTLTFTAYACQYMKDNGTAFTVTEAWTNAQDASIFSTAP